MRGVVAFLVMHAAGPGVTSLIGSSPCAQAHHTSYLSAHPPLTVRRSWPRVASVVVVATVPALPATVVALVAAPFVVAPIVAAAVIS